MLILNLKSMLNNYLNRPRKKAWAGAAIGALVGIGSAIFGASQSKKAQEKQYALQRAAQLRDTGLTSASNLTQVYSNADELDKEFKNRFYKFGGRRKAAWGADDTTALINSLGSAGSNIATGIIGQATQKANYVNAVNPLTIKDNNEAVYDSASRSQLLNDYYRTAMLKLGGRRRC